MSVAEVADRLVVSEGSVRAMIRCGELEARMVGGAWRVSHADLDAYVRAGLEATARMVVERNGRKVADGKHD